MSLKNTSYFNPTSVTGCSLWLDGADPSTITLSGSTVSQWTDKSTYGNHATQSTTANQPSYASSGIVFAGNQWLITPIGVNPTAESFFIVFKTTNNLAEIFSGINGNSREVLVVSGVMYLSRYGTNPVGLTPNGGSVSTNTVTMFNYQYTSSFVTLNLNGTTSGSGTPPVTYSGTGTSYIGSSTYAPNNMYGSIYEIIYYNSSISDTRRQQIEGYLAWKWGLVSSLPSSHPYALVPGYGVPSLVPNASVKITLTYANHPVIAAGGCILWLDGTDPLGTGVLPADGSTISTWVNKSGSAYIMSTAGGTLTYSLSTKSIIFNGSSYYSSPITNQVYTIFFVFNITANSPLFARNLISTNDGFFPNYSGTTFLCQSDSQWYTQTSTFTASTTYIVSVQYDSLNNIYMWQNGALTPTISTTKTGTITANQLSIGYKANGGVYTNGNEYEIIMFNSAISTSQRQTIEGYLAQKWGLTAGLPAGHPYKSSFPLYLPPATAIKLVGSKRWSPLTPGGCGLWLDASDTSTLFQDSAGTTPVTGGGQSIGLWKDKSGAGHDFNQTSSGNRVTYDTSTKGAIQLSSPTYLQASAASLGTVSTSANLTIIMTASTGPSASWQIILAQWFTGSSRFHLSFQDGTNLTPTLYSASSGTQLPYPMSGTMAYNRTYTIGFIATGTALYMSFMGTSNTTTMSAALSTNPSSAVTIADSRNANLTDGKIQEIIIYPSAISTAAFQQAEGYLAWKWGLKDSLPSSHPYKLFPPSP
jgi:hypothetical protein